MNLLTGAFDYMTVFNQLQKDFSSKITLYSSWPTLTKLGIGREMLMFLLLFLFVLTLLVRNNRKTPW